MNNFKKLLLSVACVLTSTVCAAQTELSVVEGSLFGRPFSTQVDNEFAATMLTNREDSSVVNLFASHQNDELTDELLKNITKEYSLNVATLFLVERLYQQERNRRLQDFYLSTIDTLAASRLEQQLSFLQDFYIVFVPAFNYESNAGNFWEQRELLEAAKISQEIIKTQQWGLVEENAELIAKQLQEISKSHRNVIVISVSKGGLETALALEKISDAETLSTIKAWINVSGILKGSPAADYWNIPKKKFWLRCGLFFSGTWGVPLNQLLNDLSYKRRKQEAHTIAIPRNIYTINFITGKLWQKKDRSDIVIPSDGYSPLLDELVTDGDVAIEMNADHTFKGVNLNVRMVALLRYIVNEIMNNEYL
ncbi:hypothetical protein AGMMS49525_01580 [Bacteroidia bacterium]|nr:hypothetical protein AGMMS49525_01580 [Bacteroidia bacterium]